MKRKRQILALFGAAVILMASAVSQAVDTRQIDEVRDKSVLERRDFDVIDGFLEAAVRELMQAMDFSSVAELRASIVSRSRSNKSTAQAQYSRQFFASARKYIAAALEKTSQTGVYRHNLLVRLNLLILVDQLNHTGLVDLALGYANDENVPVRYWAVRCLTKSEIVKQINSGGDRELAGQIMTQLGAVVESSSFEIVKLIAEFAADVKTAEADELLLRIAEMRIGRYAKWTVSQEVLEATVLRALCSKITSGSAAGPRMAQRFGQLYSYAIQRYVKGVGGNKVPGEVSLNQLITVLVEVEKRCISSLLGQDRIAIKSAVERGDMSRLMAAHDRLLGDGTKAGELMVKLNYDYGVNDDGSKRLGPLPLPEAPKSEKPVAEAPGTSS